MIKIGIVGAFFWKKMLFLFKEWMEITCLMCTIHWQSQCYIIVMYISFLSQWEIVLDLEFFSFLLFNLSCHMVVEGSTMTNHNLVSTCSSLLWEIDWIWFKWYANSSKLKLLDSWSFLIPPSPRHPHPKVFIGKLLWMCSLIILCILFLFII